MKIYYLGNFNHPETTESLIGKTLLRLGEDVTLVQEDLFDSRQILSQLKEKGCDLLFFAKGRIKDGTEGLVWLLDHYQGKKAFWLFDKMYDFHQKRAMWMDFIGPTVDFAFVTDGSTSAVEHYKRAGINYRILRQGVMQGEKYEGIEREEMKAELGFVGSIYTEKRLNLLRSLGGQYILLIRGARGMYELRGRNLADFCASAKIIIGDSLGFGNYWSNRIYLTLGAGGFYIQPRIQGLEEEFEEGKHFVAYEDGNFEELKTKIDYYLAHDDERNKIRKQGFECVWEKFTYLKRCQKFLEDIKK